MQINKLYKSEKVNNLKCSKTKLPWFSCLLQHSARKWSSYSGHLSLLPSTVLETSTSKWNGHLAVWSEKDYISDIITDCDIRLVFGSVWWDGLLQGIIAGTLLVTCNTVMFDPSVSDPLVLEHGADDYHVAAPLDSIMQLTVYEDIAAKCFSWSVRLRVGIFPSVCLPSPSRLTPQISRTV